MSKSAFYNERKLPISMIVIHASALNLDDMIDVLNKSELSCHYIISEGGEVVSLVDEDKRAWHAGIASWRGINSDINSCSIGIELCHPTLGQSDYNSKQIEALIKLCQDIIARYKIDLRNVVAHSDIAPNRKPDPGCGFPWKMLSENGVGLWYDINDANKVDACIEDLLSIIGYNICDENMQKASAYAFCRHFLPKYVRQVDDVCQLVENVLPEDFSFMKQADFIDVLRAVAYRYSL